MQPGDIVVTQENIHLLTLSSQIKLEGLNEKSMKPNQKNKAEVKKTRQRDLVGMLVSEVLTELQSSNFPQVTLE